MTEVCEVWSGGELAALILGTVGLATAGVLGVILLCVWLAQRGPLSVLRCAVTPPEAPTASEGASRITT